MSEEGCPNSPDGGGGLGGDAGGGGGDPWSLDTGASRVTTAALA